MTFSNFRATLPGRACISGAAPVPARAIDAGTWPTTAARLLDEHAVYSPATARRPGERRIELAGGSGALFRAVRGSERTHTHAGGRPALPWRGYPMPPPVAASLGSWGRLRRGTRRSSTGQARLSIAGAAHMPTGTVVWGAEEWAEGVDTAADCWTVPDTVATQKTHEVWSSQCPAGPRAATAVAQLVIHHATRQASSGSSFPDSGVEAA
ncbi:hypothetical protein MRX96_027359 [Rhipicephalus microplus]